MRATRKGLRPVGGLRLACSLAVALCAFVAVVSLSSHAARAQDAPDASELQVDGARRVVFVLPELDEEADAQLRDALLAQFSLVQAELSFAAPRPMGGTQLERLSALNAIAVRAEALAAFYLEVEPSGRWLLHVFDAERERLVLRPLDGSGAQRRAAIEAVAVMTRESTRALIEGQPLPEPQSPEPVAPAPAAAAPPAPPPAQPAAPASASPSTRSWLRPRLSLGYAATTVGDESGTRHGVALGVGQRLSDDLRVALGVDLTLPLEHTATPPFEVQAIPVRLALAGRVATHRQLVLELEGVVTLEWLLRHSRAAQADMAATTAVEPLPDAVDFLFAAGLRAHGELVLDSPWALWASLGADVLFNTFAYVAERDQARHELLSLYRVRLLGQLGVALEL